MSKEFISVIKYEGDNQTFVWKSPIEDFNMGTQLIVHESQEALFFNNGHALDLFGPGRHTLTTQNIAMLSHQINKPTGDKTPYHCEVYYINKTEQMAIKWGTDSKISYVDPKYNFPMTLGASGEMSITIADSRRILVKLVGTETYLSQSDLINKIRAILNSKIKPHLTKLMLSGKFSIFNIDAGMEEVSSELFETLVPEFEDYGIALKRFMITTFVKPDGDRGYERLKLLHENQYLSVNEALLRQQTEIIDQTTDAEKIVIDSKAQAIKRQQEGYTYQQEKGFEVAKEAAKNEGSGNFTGAGIGLGMMGGVAGGMGAVVGGVVKNAMNPLLTPASTSAQPEPQVQQVQQCASGAGQTKATDLSVLQEKIEKLLLMRKMELITEDEFQVEKNKLISGI